jgi:hypothetical protein
LVAALKRTEERKLPLGGKGWREKNKNVTNEARRLLKTNDFYFPYSLKATRLFKTNDLPVQSQEVTDNK